MNTLEILLLVALIFAIICDIIRIVCWVRFGSGRSKENIKQYICTRIRAAEIDWCKDTAYSDDSLGDYLEKNFDKYFG